MTKNTGKQFNPDSRSHQSHSKLIENYDFQSKSSPYPKVRQNLQNRTANSRGKKVCKCRKRNFRLNLLNQEY